MPTSITTSQPSGDRAARDELVVFRSETVDPSATLTQVLLDVSGRVFAFLAIPVMTWALFEALDGVPPLRGFSVAITVVLALSIAAANFVVRVRAAEVWVRGGTIAIRSVYEVATNRSLAFVPLYEVRADADHVTLAAGQRSYSIARARWPKAREMAVFLAHRLHNPGDPAGGDNAEARL
jgi:hypothetical protein